MSSIQGNSFKNHFHFISIYSICTNLFKLKGKKKKINYIVVYKVYFESPKVSFSFPLIILKVRVWALDGLMCFDASIEDKLPPVWRL